MKNIIAFCGSKGSGKSTSATLLKDLVTKEVQELAIAEHLKVVCASIYKLDIEKFLDPKLKEVELEEYIVLGREDLAAVLDKFSIKGYSFNEVIRPHLGRVIRTPRALLQYIGTEVLHPIDSLVHVKVAMAKKDPNKLTLITDLRFPAEFDYIKSNFDADFLPVYVKNSAAEVKASSDNHPSERGYLTFKSRCVVLNNEGSFDNLKTELTNLIKELV